MKKINNQMIILKKVTHSFGTHKVLDNLSFSLNKGELTALLGLNGAGKTTTIRLITGMLAPSKGKIYIKGLDPILDNKKVMNFIGILPEENILNSELTVAEHLKFKGKILGWGKKKIQKRIDYLIKEFNLEDVYYTLAGFLSKGYSQRVGLALAIFNDPEILILDEPGSGLDPEQIKAFHKLLKKISKNKCVIISSHILPEIKTLAKRVLVISEGELRYDGEYPGGSLLRKALLGEDILKDKKNNKTIESIEDEVEKGGGEANE